jgi:hypothetical protein
MTNYDIEIEKLKNLKSDYSKLSDKQLLEVLHESCGATLIRIQRTEFLIHGFVSHFNENILSRDKNFQKLNPRVFLDNDETSIKNRKQTLGTIIKFLTRKTALFDGQELDYYVELRNKFIHSFWRDFLSSGKVYKREEIYNAMEFIIELTRNDIKWQCIFKGLFYNILQYFANLSNRDISQFANLKKYEDDFLKYISK